MDYGARIMKRSCLVRALCAGVFSVICLSSEAALIGRLETSPGSGVYQAYYDDQLNISWAADVIVTGQDNWANHTNWAANLSIDDVTGWRLANVDKNSDGVLVNCSTASASECLDNELGYQLFVNNITPMTPGPFTNFDQSGLYVSGTEFAPDTDFVWDVSISLTRGIGSFAAHLKTTSTFYAWAVHDGDVGAVPVPAAVWLFGSGLLALIGVARRKKSV